MARIGKCKKCGGELFLIGKNYFSKWEQHKCNKCGEIFGCSFEEYLKNEEKEKIRWLK